jgi:hypothetical protein
MSLYIALQNEPDVNYYDGSLSKRRRFFSYITHTSTQAHLATDKSLEHVSTVSYDIITLAYRQGIEQTNWNVL